MYIALSRFTSLKRPHFTDELKATDIRANTRAI